jgi:hypothetical protein
VSVTAEHWLDGYLEANGIDWDKLTKGEQFKITMLVPCSIRCFRVGGAVDVKPGEECPECGKERPLLTVWERLLEDNPS